MEVIGVAVAVTTVLLAVLAWRLSAGPVSFAILNQMIEDAANPALQGGSLDVGDTVLIWAAEERELSLRLTDVRLTGADGNRIANVPQVAFELSTPALFRGMLAPKTIDLYGVRARILRRPGAGITFALASADAELDPEAPSFLGPMLEALTGEGDSSSPFGYLTRLGIRQARLQFVDEVNDVVFDAPAANLIMYRGEGGIAGMLNADFVVGGTMAHLEMNGILRADADAARIDVEASNLIPAELARMSAAFEDYAVFDAPLAAKGSVQIKRDGALGSAQLTLQAGAGQIDLPAPWDTEIPLEKARAEIEIDGAAQHLELKELALEAGPHSVSLKGTVDYRMDTGLNIAAAAVSLSADRFHTEVPGFFAGPVDLDQFQVKADLDFEALKADIDELFIGVGGGGIRLSGSVANEERSPAVKISGRIEPVPFDAFTAIWPLPLAKGAREWVGKNLSGGTITDGSFDLDLKGGMIADAVDHVPIPKENIRFAFSATGPTMKYLRDMPPMENLEARGLIEGDRFDAWISSAVIRQPDLGDVAISDGHFYDDTLHIKGALGHIAFTAAGATADILSLLDHEPLNLISRFGLDPRTVGGTGTLAGKISLPLVKGVTMEQVDVSGTAHADNVAIPEIQKGMSVTSGSLDVEVSRTGLSARGPIGLNNAAELELEWRENFQRDASPTSVYRLRGMLDDGGRAALGLRLDAFIAGSADIDATLMGDGRSVNRATVKADLTDSVVKLDYAGWWKKAGTAAMTNFAVAFLEDGGYRISDFVLTGDDIEASGWLVLGDDGRMVAADFPVVKLGPHNDFSFVAGSSENASLAMNVTGNRFDARGVLDNMFSGDADGPDSAEKEPSTDPLPVLSELASDPMRRNTLRADIAQATGHNETSFTDVKVNLVQVDGRTWTMALDAVDQGGAPVRLGIGPDDTGVRSLDVSSSDAGNIFRALDFTRSVRGGTLTATGRYDDTKYGSPLRGTVLIDNFRIADAPVLANILTLGSLTGIGDTLRGEGILFNRLELPFTITENRIRMKDARMSGPAIGLTMNGQVDRSADVIDMEGTLVPAYTINSFLGQVPVLGPIIVGREGEGIFAITYSVRGKADDPTVVVNPLSAIAPGFLRRLFEFGSTLPSEPGSSGQSGAAPAVSPPDETVPEVAKPQEAAPSPPPENSAAPQN
ncbi:MAG: AsmA-like C-terminal domain-containing protein [Parvibaculum sp.]